MILAFTTLVWQLVLIATFLNKVALFLSIVRFRDIKIMDFWCWETLGKKFFHSDLFGPLRPNFSTT